MAAQIPVTDRKMTKITSKVNGKTEKTNAEIISPFLGLCQFRSQVPRSAWNYYNQCTRNGVHMPSKILSEPLTIKLLTLS